MKSLTRLTKSAAVALRREKFSFQPERELERSVKFVTDNLYSIQEEYITAKSVVAFLDRHFQSLSNEEKCNLWTLVVSEIEVELYDKGFWNSTLAHCGRLEVPVTELLSRRLNHEELDSPSLLWEPSYNDKLHQKILADIWR